MPIVRTYACPECNHRIEVMLEASQWDDPPPSCEACDAREMAQEFKPLAIGGSVRSRAVALAEDIVANDYKVANFHAPNREGDVAKVRYKDQATPTAAGGWAGPAARDYQVTQEALQTAMAAGRQTRLKYGNGLDVLKHTLATGDQPDLIELSKKRSTRIW